MVLPRLKHAASAASSIDACLSLALDARGDKSLNLEPDELRVQSDTATTDSKTSVRSSLYKLPRFQQHSNIPYPLGILQVLKSNANLLNLRDEMSRYVLASVFPLY